MREDMIYYAHSVENQPESQCQTLSDHLSQVGEMAARFAGFFGAGETARYTGQLHDLGKYSEAIHKRMNDGLSVDHATAGAKISVMIDSTNSSLMSLPSRERELKLDYCHALDKV